MLLLPVWGGLIVFTALGQPLQGLLVALGGYIVLFGGGRPLRPRLRAYALAAVGLLTAVAVGMVVAGSSLLILAGYLATAFVAVFLKRWLDPGPPGAYFFVLMMGAGTLLSGSGIGVPLTLAYIALGSLLAMLVGALDAVLTRPGPPPLPRPAPFPDRVVLVRICLAVTAAMTASWLLADRHPFWTVLVVVLVLSYPGDTGQLTVRALSRLLGTAVGVLVFLPLSGLHLGTAGFVAALCVLLWFVARWTARNYLIGSVLITVLALFMSVPLMPAEPPVQLAIDRGVDTLIAGVIAFAALWLFPFRARRAQPPTPPAATP
ncbi:hypothetical protein GCM10025789_02160 [Tessaracoccus lubricantis]|uniref:Integral membrane bound transporter domain-containing protein n=1 Tax=Tessaracoccus lubricantis TaxID=545543 RepID=A0ABP9F037_9ACTN